MGNLERSCTKDYLHWNGERQQKITCKNVIFLLFIVVASKNLYAKARSLSFSNYALSASLGIDCSRLACESNFSPVAAKEADKRIPGESKWIFVSVKLNLYYPAAPCWLLFIARGTLGGHSAARADISASLFIHRSATFSAACASVRESASLWADISLFSIGQIHFSPSPCRPIWSGKIWFCDREYYFNFLFQKFLE